MDDAHAPQPLARALRQKLAQQLPCVDRVEPVQVQLVLDEPVPAAQFPEDMGADAGAHEAQLLTGLEIAARRDGVQALAQRRLLVTPRLQRQRVRPLELVQDPARLAQRGHVAHRRAEEFRFAADLRAWRLRSRSGFRRLLREPVHDLAFASFGRKAQISPRLSRNFCASSAAMHPVPALVTAWRYTWSCTSPAAKTPGMLVAVAPPSRPLFVTM